MIQSADMMMSYNFHPQNPSFPNCSSSDEERKQRRMISNRESARRSRMRKQRQMDELWSQVIRLRADNHNLIEKMNQLCESHDRVVQENVKLKEEASEFRRMLTDLQLLTPLIFDPHSPSTFTN